MLIKKVQFSNWGLQNSEAYCWHLYDSTLCLVLVKQQGFVCVVTFYSAGNIDYF